LNVFPRVGVALIFRRSGIAGLHSRIFRRFFMFQIKICGITRPADAWAACEAGADAIGLNFYHRSSRYVARDVARSIARKIGDRAWKVGVFVNATPEEIAAVCDEVGLDAVQLHGDEPPSLIRRLAPRPVIKAFRLGPDGLAPIGRWFDECMHTGTAPPMVLLDAYQPGEYGGTGQTADWRIAGAFGRTPGMPPWALAGGLTPANVAQAISEARPGAVDTAGGVEVSPGIKDAQKIEEFVAAARAGFTALAAG
jgi:phosphoribosylanthranilate isomerase